MNKDKELEELTEIVKIGREFKKSHKGIAVRIQLNGYTKKHFPVEKLREHIDDGIDFYDTMKGDTDFNRGMIAGRIASWIDVRDKIKELKEE